MMKKILVLGTFVDVDCAKSIGIQSFFPSWPTWPFVANIFLYMDGDDFSAEEEDSRHSGRRRR